MVVCGDPAAAVELIVDHITMVGCVEIVVVLVAEKIAVVVGVFA